MINELDKASSDIGLNMNLTKRLTYKDTQGTNFTSHRHEKAGRINKRDEVNAKNLPKQHRYQHPNGQNLNKAIIISILKVL